MSDDLLCGVPELPPVRQPNGYTCGPSCLRMVLNHLCFLPDMPLARLSRQMGCNPQTGTTEVEMARGLALCGLSYTRPGLGFGADGVEALDHLRGEIEDGKLVLLRTLMQGTKHWVVVHAFGGEDNDLFEVTCPVLGRETWEGKFLLEGWAARGYDHMSLPAQRRLHPEAMAMERRMLQQGWRPVHQMTLAEFIGPHPVIEEADFRPWHHALLARSAQSIPMLARHPKARLMDYDAAPGFRFLAVPGQGLIDFMVVVDAANGAVAGGIDQGTRWVDPGYRGRGLGAELALAAHSEPGSRFLAPVSYSRAGWASRVAAHRLAVGRALEAGLDVPEHIRREAGHDNSEPVMAASALRP